MQLIEQLSILTLGIVSFWLWIDKKIEHQVMNTKLPLLSLLSSKPLWNDDGISGRQDSIHRSDYRPNIPDRQHTFKAPSSRPKVWALISRLPIDHSYEDPLLPTQPVIDDVNQNRRYWRRRGQIEISQEPFERVTDYRREYIPKEGDRVVIDKPKHEPLKSSEPFTAVSSYKRDYLYPNLRQNDLSTTTTNSALIPVVYEKSNTWSDISLHQQQQQSTWKSPTKPFSSETSYSVQFPSYWNYPMRNPIKPEEKVIKSQNPFQCQSDYRENFQRKEIPLTNDGKKVLQNLNSMGYRGSGDNNDWKLIPLTIATTATTNNNNNNYLPFEPIVEHGRSVFYGANNPQIEKV